MPLQAGLLILSLVVLSLGADLFVRGAGSLARRAGLSPLFIGLTVVGFGTSTPELFTSVVAGVRELDDIAVGNIVGSNTFNLAVILGLVALVRPLAVGSTAVRRQAWLVVLVAMIPFTALATGQVLGRLVGALMMAGLAAYLWGAYRADRRTQEAASPAPASSGPPLATSGAIASILFLVFGLVALIAGSSLLTDAASDIAARIGISQLAIGLTVVAAGTSAPELFTSLMAVLRKEMDVAVGNVFGSNIFNVLGILGVTCVLEPQSVKPQVLALDAPVMLAASICMVPIIVSRSRISRLEGAALLTGYALYVVVLLSWAPVWFPPA